MENFNVSRKVLLGISAVCLIAFGAGIFGIQKYNSDTNRLMQAQSGSGVCFQRITQTFTALMVRDTGSQFLGKDFKDTTLQCLEQLSGLVASSKAMSQALNKLQSDYHWFDKKVSRALSMTDVDWTQSNVVNKYTELEEIKDSFENELAAVIASTQGSSQLAFFLMVLGVLGTLFGSAALVVRAETREKKLRGLEAKVSDYEIDLLFTKLFELLDMPEVERRMKAKTSEVEAENHRLEDSLLKMNTMGEEVVYEIPLPTEAPVRQVSSFQDSYNHVLDNLQDKAFESGVILDTDLNEDFSIFSPKEPLEQLLFSLFNFGMENADRVEIRSKALGGIAYCKVRIPGFVFSDQDLGFMNGKEASENTNLNLILLRELLADAEAKVAVRNRKNSKENSSTAELEVIFDRAQVEMAVEEIQKDVQVVKGNKRQIREFLDQQLDA